MAVRKEDTDELDKALESAKNTDQIGINTLAILNEQEKKIQQTSDDVNVIKDDTKATEENLRKIKCCCCFICPFRCWRPCKKNEIIPRPKEPPPREINDQTTGDKDTLLKSEENLKVVLDNIQNSAVEVGKKLDNENKQLKSLDKDVINNERNIRKDTALARDEI